MAIRLYNVDKWTRLAAGEMVRFPGKRQRPVTVEVNAPGEARLDIVDAVTGETRFLAIVYGRQTLEFTAGAFSIASDLDDTFIYTAEGEEVHHVNPAPESYTRIMEKRARNPELERIAHQITGNITRRLEAQLDERTAVMERRYAARAAQLEAEAAARRAESEPAPSDDADAPGDEAAGTDAGNP